MYAQCPNCEIVFSVRQEQLEVRQGLVRCGRCREVFNAAWNLIDRLPDHGHAGAVSEPAPPPVMPPAAGDSDDAPRSSRNSAPVRDDAPPVADDLGRSPLSPLPPLVQEDLPTSVDLDDLTTWFNAFESELDQPEVDDAASAEPPAAVELPEDLARLLDDRGDDADAAGGPVAGALLAQPHASPEPPRVAPTPTPPAGAEGHRPPRPEAPTIPPRPERRQRKPDRPQRRSRRADALAGEEAAASTPRPTASTAAGRRARRRRRVPLAANLAGGQRVPRRILAGMRPTPMLTWSLVGVLSVLALSAQLVAFYKDDLARVDGLRPVASLLCAVAGCRLAPRSDPDSIEIVETRVLPHPDTPGALRVRASFVSRADFAQPYPFVQVTLTDKIGNIVGRRTFSPQQYLMPERRSETTLSPNVIEIVSLDLAQPDETAVGYEIELVLPTAAAG